MYSRQAIQNLAVVTIVTISATAGVQAQTKPVAPPPSSAYGKLSLGNQMVASALYQAQTPAVGTTARPLSLEQVAAKRHSGQAWGQIFRELKAQGLVHEQSLGQVVARYQKTTDGAPSVVASDNSGGKSRALEVGSNDYASGAAHGVGKGGK